MFDVISRKLRIFQTKIKTNACRHREKNVLPTRRRPSNPPKRLQQLAIIKLKRPMVHLKLHPNPLPPQSPRHKITTNKSPLTRINRRNKLRTKYLLRRRKYQHPQMYRLRFLHELREITPRLDLQNC